MVVGGLWHGASWMFMIWGGLQGLFLVGHKAIAGKVSRESRLSTPKWRVALNIFLTFNLLAFSFVFFRARSMDDVKAIGTQIFTNFHLNVAPQFFEGYLMIVLVIIGAMLMHFAPSRWTAKLKSIYAGLPLLIQALVLALIVFIVIQARQSDIMPFIYFQY
ncbi:MAG: MBOAT family protein, partial [Paramuribaculum sp.]|nr:MBOAT family protein [Paramuribaculum sp.]